MNARAGTFVDSSVLLDVFTADARWLDWLERTLADAFRQGPLAINAIVAVSGCLHRREERA